MNSFNQYDTTLGTLKMDETWEAFAIPNTYEEFCTEVLPLIFLKETVNENVRNSFSVVRSLLEHSFFNYQFYDVAALKAMFTFEMAARSRYKEITDEDWDGSLGELISWFDKQHYFEVYNKYFLKAYRRFRNSLAHPTSHSFSGPNKRQWIMHTVNLINDMYEDPKLRYYRKNVHFLILNKLKEFKEHGFIVSLNSHQTICFEIVLAFINNKLKPMEMHFYFKPLFEIPKDFLLEHKIYDSPVYFVTANGFKIFDDSIKLNTVDGEVVISKIDSEPTQEKYNDWINLYKKYNDQVMEDAHWNSQTADFFAKHLSEFHTQ